MIDQAGVVARAGCALVAMPSKAAMAITVPFRSVMPPSSSNRRSKDPATNRMDGRQAHRDACGPGHASHVLLPTRGKVYSGREEMSILPRAKAGPRPLDDCLAEPPSFGDDQVWPGVRLTTTLPLAWPCST